MKKNILFALSFLVLGLVSSMAQEPKFGMRVGANLSSISSGDIPSDIEDPRIGVVVGFFAEYALSDKISIQPEMQYSSQGNKEAALRTNYLQLPVVFKYKIGERFNIHAGPQAGLKIWEWEKNKNYKNFNFSAVVGIGVNITNSIFVDFRYDHGLSNVFDDENSFEFEGTSRNFQLSVGYRLE